MRRFLGPAGARDGEGVHTNRVLGFTPAPPAPPRCKGLSPSACGRAAGDDTPRPAGAGVSVLVVLVVVVVVVVEEEVVSLESVVALARTVVPLS